MSPVASALRPLLVATRLLGQALGRAVATRAETVDALRLTCARLEQENVLLRARLARMPARRRPHYAPHERWRLLELRALHGWSLAEAAD